MGKKAMAVPGSEFKEPEVNPLPALPEEVLEPISREDFLLASCYLHCLRLLVENQLSSIAFPAISTGAFRFPIERATEIAVGSVAAALAESQAIRKVVFCCFSRRDFDIYSEVARRLLAD